MRTADELAATSAYMDATGKAQAAREGYEALRTRKFTQTHTLERARSEWGLARIEQATALVAKAAAEDAARSGGAVE